MSSFGIFNHRSLPSKEGKVLAVWGNYVLVEWHSGIYLMVIRYQLFVPAFLFDPYHEWDECDSYEDKEELFQTQMEEGKVMGEGEGIKEEKSFDNPIRNNEFLQIVLPEEKIAGLSSYLQDYTPVLKVWRLTGFGTIMTMVYDEATQEAYFGTYDGYVGRVNLRTGERFVRWISRCPRGDNTNYYRIDHLVLYKDYLMVSLGTRTFILDTVWLAVIREFSQAHTFGFFSHGNNFYMTHPCRHNSLMICPRTLDMKVFVRTPPSVPFSPQTKGSTISLMGPLFNECLFVGFRHCFFAVFSYGSYRYIANCSIGASPTAYCLLTNNRFAVATCTGVIHFYTLEDGKCGKIGEYKDGVYESISYMKYDVKEDVLYACLMADPYTILAKICVKTCISGYAGEKNDGRLQLWIDPSDPSVGME